MNKKFSLILLSGGRGQRFGKGQPKQYALLGKKPLAFHSLETFLSMENLEELVIVCDKPFESLFLTKAPKALFATPGTSRQNSVLSGFKKLLNQNNPILIHDIARPFITKNLINKLLDESKAFEAAALAVPISNTIKEVDSDSLVKKTLNRDHLWALQTPQKLSFNILKEGSKFLEEHPETITDDLALAELLGYKAKIVESDERNFKITTVNDLTLAQYILDGEFH